MDDRSGLLPQQLRGVWQQVTEGRLTTEAAVTEQDRLIAQHRRCWAQALIEPGRATLEESLLGELGAYVGSQDLDALRAQCREAVQGLKAEWLSRVDRNDDDSVFRYYRETKGILHELIWWHTLTEDDSPLAYVNALDLAMRGDGRRYLDFGSGVGSGGLLFARAAFEVTLADVSAPLLTFCRWRFSRRGLRARFLDTAVDRLPEAAFDVITAMDVFEHLTDPVTVAEDLVRALAPGGLLVARLHADDEPDRPQHIVTDFAAVFERLADMGCVKIWDDDWLWGHQAFQK